MGHSVGFCGGKANADRNAVRGASEMGESLQQEAVPCSSRRQMQASGWVPLLGAPVLCKMLIIQHYKSCSSGTVDGVSDAGIRRTPARSAERTGVASVEASSKFFEI